MSDEVIQNMRGRIAQCRRLAEAILDDRAKDALLTMASEIESDMLRLEAERDGPRNRPTPLGS
jgi:hypothetical protein